MPLDVKHEVLFENPTEVAALVKCQVHQTDLCMKAETMLFNLVVVSDSQ